MNETTTSGLDVLIERIDRVLELHRPAYHYRRRGQRCREDGFAWPCPTVRTLDGTHNDQHAGAA